MQLVFNNLKLCVDNYKRSINLICNKNESQGIIENIINQFVSKEIVIGYLDSSMKINLENRYKYGKDKILSPIAIIVEDRLDLLWLYKMQEIANIYIIAVTEEKADSVPCSYYLKRVTNNYWNYNGRIYEIREREMEDILL